MDRQPAVSVKCANCGAEYKVPPNQLRRGKGKFCSTTCVLAYKRKERPIDIDLIKHMYLDEGMTGREIGIVMGFNRTTIEDYLKAAGVKLRPGRCYKGAHYTFEIDKGWLFEEYITKQRMPSDIAKDIGCSTWVVWSRLYDYDIPTRSFHDAVKLLSGENHYGYVDLDADMLRRMYVDEHKTTHQMAQELGCSQTAVYVHLENAQIPLRPSATIEPRRGENHPRWLGGRSFDPYCPKFNKAFKESIREKFGRKCYLCDNIEKGCKFSVHHIDYNKNSICNGKEWAFVPLCPSHHAATNHRRWYWFNLLINYWVDKYIKDGINL